MLSIARCRPCCGLLARYDFLPSPLGSRLTVGAVSYRLATVGLCDYRSVYVYRTVAGGLHTTCAPQTRIIYMVNVFRLPPPYGTLTFVWTRYSAFQVVSTYTNTGMSLVDESLVPFQRAYPMILCMIILILAGNTAFVRASPATVTVIANVTIHFSL